MNKDKPSQMKITNISRDAMALKGFDERGCFGCNCKDSCCRFGADFDKESYELLLENRELVEEQTGIKIEDCFLDWSGDPFFLGGNSIEGKLHNGTCIFHNRKGKGCILFGLVIKHGLDRRMIPSTCRLFPLTWDKTSLVAYPEIKIKQMPDIPEDCNVFEEQNKVTKSLLQTQAFEIKDIFGDIDPKLLQ